MAALAHDHQTARIKRAVNGHQIVPTEAEVLQQQGANLQRASVLYLQADGLAVAAGARLDLDRFKQGGHDLFVGVKLAVAGDAEMPPAEDVRSGKEIGHIMSNQVAHKDIMLLAGVGARQFDQAREHARDFDQSQTLASLRSLGGFHLHDEVEGLVGQFRKRMGGVQPQRSQDRPDLRAVKAAPPTPDRTAKGR